MREDNIVLPGKTVLISGPTTLTLPESRGIRSGDLARLMLVTFLWALCYPLIATGLAAAPPFAFAALRSFVAAVALLVPAFVLRRPLPQSWQVWLVLLGVGLSTTSLGFAGMFLAGGVVSPGLATVLANTQPLIAAVLAYIVLRERLGSQRYIGLLLGFAGIILVALPSFDAGNDSSTPLGVAYVLLGAIGVAIGNVLLKRLAGQVDLLMATGWQFILGGLPLSVIAWRFEWSTPIAWSLPFVAVLLSLGILGTALPFVLWFSLLHQGELSYWNTFTFLTPILGLIIGIALFNERLSLAEMAGIGLVLAGVWWISRSPRAARHV